MDIKFCILVSWICIFCLVGYDHTSCWYHGWVLWTWHKSMVVVLESWIGVTDLLEYTYICFIIISNYHRILN